MSVTAETADQLRLKQDALRNMHGVHHQQIEKNRRYYDLDFDVDVVPPASADRGLVAVIPPTARQAIDEAVDHILFVPKVRVPVRPTESETTTAQNIAEKKRKFLTSWWRQVTQLTNPIGDGRKPLINEGKIAIRKSLRWDLIPNKPAKIDNKYRNEIAKLGKYDFLWDVELLDNVTVFEDPSDHRNPKYIFVSYDIFVEDAKEQFPDAKGEWTKGNDYDKVKYMEYWSAPKFRSDGGYDYGSYVQWIESDIVHNSDNPYPYIPIAVEDAGFGTVRKGSKPEERFVGFSQYSFSVFVAQARQWSAMEAVAEYTAFSPIVTRNMDESKVANLQLGPGEVWSLEGNKDEPDSESIEFPVLPNIPITVPQMIQLTDRAANSTLKIDLLGGIAQTGVDTATEADQNVRNASAKLSAPVAALERLTARLSRWVLMDIELVLEAPVTIYGVHSDDPAEVTLGPKDIAGYYDIAVELRTTDDEAVSMNKARFWLEMALRAPFLSFFTALERGGVVDDPMAEMLKRASEEVFLSEQFKMIRIMTGAQSFGELAQLLQNQGLVEGGAGGVGPGLNEAQTAPVAPQDAVPVQDSIQNQALVNRDINFGSSQLFAAGPRTY